MFHSLYISLSDQRTFPYVICGTGKASGHALRTYYAEPEKRPDTPSVTLCIPKGNMDVFISIQPREEQVTKKLKENMIMQTLPQKARRHPVGRFLAESMV